MRLFQRIKQAFLNAAKPESSFYDLPPEPKDQKIKRQKGQPNSNPYRFHGYRYPFRVR